jgi:hypothetical protein
MTEPTPQKIRATIEELVIKYKPQEFRVEINAHQKAYSLDDELRNWLAGYGVRLDAHFTGKTSGTHPSVLRQCLTSLAQSAKKSFKRTT